jgi:hypothetical protein
MSRRKRTREFAPVNSGSVTRPERVNLRCTTEECGRFLSLVSTLRLIKGRPEEPIAETVHHVLVPLAEKLIRAVRFGSAAEQSAARVYFEERVRREDYVKNRHQRYQPTLF